MWQAITDPETRTTYYLDIATNKTVWHPPEFEEQERALGDLESCNPSPKRTERSEVTAWRRCFAEDTSSLSAMKEAIEAAKNAA